MFNNSVGLKLGKVSVKDPAAALMFDCCSAAADVRKKVFSVLMNVVKVSCLHTTGSICFARRFNGVFLFLNIWSSQAGACVRVRIQRTGRGHMTDSISDEGTR